MFIEGLRYPKGGNNWQSRFPTSEELNSGIHAGGTYVYVVDEDENVIVAPNAPHRHPEILGHGRPAFYAGEIELDSQGEIIEVNNLSGTFGFESSTGLQCVASHLIDRGFTLAPDSLCFFDPDGRIGKQILDLP